MAHCQTLVPLFRSLPPLDPAARERDGLHILLINKMQTEENYIFLPL